LAIRHLVYQLREFRVRKVSARLSDPTSNVVADARVAHCVQRGVRHSDMPFSLRSQHSAPATRLFDIAQSGPSDPKHPKFPALLGFVASRTMSV
jgi:hypothetical protein